MSVMDFLMGSGTLKKAAEGPKPPAAPKPPATPSGIDLAAEAQKAADRAHAPAAPAVKGSGKTTLSSPMTPIKKAKGN